jgi:hypothetical protein
LAKLLAHRTEGCDSEPGEDPLSDSIRVFVLANFGGVAIRPFATSTPIILRQQRKSFTFRKNFLGKIR